MSVLSEIESIWPYFITHGGPEVFMFFMTFGVVPAIYMFVLRPLVRPLAVQLSIALGLWLAAGVFAYWDTFVIARQAEKLCRHAGMKVLRTVEASGFAGSSDIKNWSKRGFSWLEVSSLEGEQRIELENDQVVIQKIPKLTAQYEFVREEERWMPPCCSEVKEIIRDRMSGEELGSVTLYIIYAGFLDRKLIGALGFSWTPPRCVQPDTLPSVSPEGEIYPIEFISSVIKPARD
ncbi:MAG: hypothetical protein AB7I32_14375 [Gammaproteobacteria bacterium]